MKLKKRALALAAAAAVMGVQIPVYQAQAANAPKEFYVDYAKGTTGGNGSISNPFKTITQARDAVKKINASMTSDINVYLRDGNHFIDETIFFTTEDSGSNGYSVNYMAYKDEKPVINGAKQITGWKLHDAEKNIYKAPALGIETRHLYVNDQRCVRARHNVTLTEAKKNDTGYICSDTYLQNLKKPDDLEFSYVILWTNPRGGVADIKPAADGKTEIIMDQPGWKYVTSSVRGSQVNVANPEWMENAYEFLDEPGEFYLDKDEDVFYYMPKENENLDTATVYAPFVEEMVRIEGDDIDNKVHDISFTGITFKYNTWNRPSTKSNHADTQCNYIMDTEGDYHRMISAALTVRRGVNIPISDCELSKLGSIAIKVEEGTQYSDIVGNHVYDISGTGIALGEVIGPAVSSTDTRYFCRGNDVMNNLIENVGIDYMSSVGISAGFPMESEISHNEIIGSYYSGMHIGYGWANHQFTGTNTRDFKITDNLIGETMKYCHDGGGIYVLGATGGSKDNRNIISGNYIYDLVHPNGIMYADEGSSYWSFENNVIDNYKNKTGRWMLIWLGTIHYIDLKNNYTNIQNFTNEGSNCVETDTHYVLDSEWPKEALDIIEHAGLEPEYKERMKGQDKSDIGKIMVEFPSNVKKNDVIPLDYTVKAVGGYDLQPNDYEIKFESDREDIVSVDKNGTMTVVGEGIANIKIIAERNGKVTETMGELVADDVLTEIGLTPANNITAVGVERQLNISGTSRFGKEVSELELTFESLNPDMAVITSGGKLNAVAEGEFDIKVTATNKGTTVSKVINMKAVMPGSSAELDGYEKYKLDNELKDETGWHVLDGIAENSGDSITLDGNFATYKNKTFKNQLIEFNLTCNKGISWPTITFNNSTYNVCALSPNTDAYLIVIKPDEFELQRWKNGTGTMIYGVAPGRVTIEPGIIQNSVLFPDEEAYVQLGTFDEPDGVRIIFWVNGQKVIDYLDKSDEALRGGGYFGILEQTTDRTMTISPPQVIIKEAVDMKTVFNDISGHWAEGVIEAMYTKELVDGFPDGSFKPDKNITRAEFVTMVLRALDTDEYSSRGYFKDCQSGAWYEKYIGTAVDKGMIDINLVKDDCFNPDSYITREEMASIAAAACKLKGMDGIIYDLSVFTDNGDISNWAKDYFEIVCGLGVINGKGDNVLAPKANATRAEATKILNELSELK